MQENKTTNIEVKKIGEADISHLPRCEQTVFYSVLLKRISELAGGER